MNKNIMIVLAGGFLIAVIVAVIVQASLSSGKKEQKVSQTGGQIKIVVAAKNLSTGDELKEDNLRYQKWPENAVFEGAIRQEKGKKPHELVQGTLRRALAEGEPVMKSALVPEERYNYMTASLAPGMRAYSLKLSAEELAGGFVKPGDHVDLLLTYRASVRYRGNNNAIKDMIESNLNNKATETILQNIKVIAVGQDIEREEEGENGKKKKNAKAAIVTFEVTRKQAEVIAMARDVGKVSLSLRKLGDDTVLADLPPSTSDARITSIYDEILEKVYRMEKNTSQAGNIVRIYTGVDIEEVTVGQ